MANTKKMLEEIIKNAEYTQKNKALHGAWIGEDGYQYCTDSFRAVMIYNPVDVKERESEQTLSVKVIFDNAEIDCTEIIDLPSPKEIRAKISDLIGRKYRTSRVLYRVGDDVTFPALNAKYLVECMEAIGATKLKYNPSKPATSPVLMETDLGKIALCPVRSITNKTGYWVS